MDAKRALDTYKNAKVNIKLGAVSKMVKLTANFIVQTMLIRCLGMEYAGVQGVFVSVLSVMNLAELGVGSAIIYSMYKPIAENNDTQICAILNYYKRIYKAIGCVIVGLAVLLLPFLNYFFKNGVSKNINLYIIFALFVANAVVPYWMFSYKLCILNAFQQTNIISITEICSSILTIAGNGICLMLLKNYYLSLLFTIVVTALYNVMIYFYVDKHYPNYTCHGEINVDLRKEIRKMVSGVFISKMCALSRNAFDNVFIAAFLGATIAGVYSNYYYVMDAIVVFFSIVAPAIIGGIGNNIQLKSIKENLDDMLIINNIYMFFSGWAAVCLLCLYQSFISLWLGEAFLFPFGIVLLLVIYFYIRQMGNVRAIYSDAAGLFWENRYRSLMETISNIVLNYIMVKMFGIYGIIAATILTLFVFGYISSAIILFKHYFKVGTLRYFMNCTKGTVSTVIVATITYFVCMGVKMNSIIGFLLKFIICCFIPPILYYIIYRRSDAYNDFVVWIRDREQVNRKEIR